MKKIWSLFFACLSALLLMGDTASAGLVEYTYTGDCFTYFAFQDPKPQNHITAHFVAEAFGAEDLPINNYWVTPIMFTMSDGEVIFDIENYAAPQYSLYIYALSNEGIPLQWELAIVDSETLRVLASWCKPESAVDRSYVPNWYGDQSVTGSAEDPQGSWVVNNYQGPLPVATPEPASMLLLGAGLVGMAAFRRKFKK